MQLVFSDQKLPLLSVTKSLFLAGPSPRSCAEHDWRHEAIAYLNKLGYDGTVFIPCPRWRFETETTGNWDYMDQIEWECQARDVADVLVFWVPRDINNGMPAFTTNIEFGEDLNSGRMLYGRPPWAEKCRYLDVRAQAKNMPVFQDLEELLTAAVKMVGKGAYRTGGESQVPLFVWESPQFQTWYQGQLAQGNSLHGAKVLHQVKFSNGYLFSFVLWVDMWVKAENRRKSNEFIFARKDIAIVLPYFYENNEAHVVLVSEFRSAVNNSLGLVLELPGGSSLTLDKNALQTAQEELHEEAGIVIEDLARFTSIEPRQMCATLCTHKAHGFAVELTPQEVSAVRENVENNVHFGLAQDEEITHLHILKVSDLVTSSVDNSMLGIILGFFAAKNR